MVLLVNVLFTFLDLLRFGISLLVINCFVLLVLMCVNPCTIVVESRASKRKRSINVPCGKCVECLKRRQNDWKLRLVKESESWSHVYFFTLTYRDDVLPCNVCFNDVYDEIIYTGRLHDCESFLSDNKCDASIYSTVNFDDVQNWLKRFRTNYERKNKTRWNVKYFICSEYGPNPKGTKRPHYHGIFMTDLEYNDLKPMFNEWHSMFGRVQFDECGLLRNDKSSVANYVSKYCAKGCFESRAEDISYKRIKRAYSCMSKNIGLAWLERHSNDWLKYVPSFLEVDGDWDIDMVQSFFDKMSISAPEDYSRWMLELDNLILNLRIYDGDRFSYSIPRYYYNRLFGKLINDVKPQTVTKNGKPVSNLKPFLQSVHSSQFRFAGCPPFAYFCALEPITYDTKMAKNSRYVSSSFLSASIAYRLRMQFIARFGDDFNRLIKLGYSDSEAFCVLLSREANARLARESFIKLSLCNFYESNMWKNRELDFDADSYNSQLFTNF